MPVCISSVCCYIFRKRVCTTYFQKTEFLTFFLVRHRPIICIHRPLSTIIAGNHYKKPSRIKMPRPFGTLSRGARRQEVAHQRAREEAMAGIDRTYKLLEVYPQMRIEPTQHVTLGVRCEPFALNEDPDDPRSSDSPTGEPTFFLPRRVPEVDIDSPGCEQEVNYLSQYWGDDKSIQTSSSLTVQSWDLWSRIEKMFVLFRLQEEPPLDEGYKRSLCQIAEWQPRYEIPVAYKPMIY